MITRRENLKLLCSLPLINLNLDIPQEYKKAQINFRSSNTKEWLIDLEIIKQEAVPRKYFPGKFYIWFPNIVILKLIYLKSIEIYEAIGVKGDINNFSKENFLKSNTNIWFWKNKTQDYWDINWGNDVFKLCSIEYKL